jgi:hypothetical protein
MSEGWRPSKDYPAVSNPPTVRMVEGGFYWVETAKGWVVAQYENDKFWVPGSNWTATPLAICGPLTPPPNNTTKP